MSRSQQSISLLIVAFFSFCLFQQYGFREDWPFSYFGMYKYAATAEKITRFDLEYIPPDGPAVNLYHKEDGFYFNIKFRRIATGERIDFNNNVIEPEGNLRMDPETLRNVRSMLVNDALPILARRNLDDPAAVVRVRYRRWFNFDAEAPAPPESDVIVMALTLAELRGRP